MKPNILKQAEMRHQEYINLCQRRREAIDAAKTAGHKFVTIPCADCGRIKLRVRIEQAEHAVCIICNRPGRPA